MTGQRFGKLTVLYRGENTSSGQTRWVCRCDCGNITNTVAYSLTHGLIVSCGCYQREITINRNRKHNMSNTRIYRIYREMLRRCYDSKRPTYKDYGGRGIIVCDEWKNDFMSFYKWAIKNGYTDNLTIERIDVNGNYCPENCTWIIKEDQSKNRRMSHKITINGETYCIAEWAKIMNIKPRLIMVRLNRGWTEYDAVMTPIIPSKSKHKETYNMKRRKG